MEGGAEGVGMRSRRHGGDGGAASLRPALARSRERPREVRLPPPSPPAPTPILPLPGGNCCTCPALLGGGRGGGS